MWTDVNLSWAHLSKIVWSGGFLGKTLRNGEGNLEQKAIVGLVVLLSKEFLPKSALIPFQWT